MALVMAVAAVVGVVGLRRGGQEESGTDGVSPVREDASQRRDTVDEPDRPTG